MRAFAVAASVALLCSACGHVSHVRPTPKGQLDVQAAVGGPLARLGPVFPVPLSTVGASYGLNEKVDVSAHLHVTSLAFGVGGLDVGATYMPVAEKGAIPAISLTGRVYGFTDLQAARPYFEASAAASYLFGKHFLTYFSATGLLQFAGGPPLWALAVGEEFQIGRFGLALEARWYDPSYQTQFNVVDWVNIRGQGALGVVLGFRYRFGETR